MCVPDESHKDKDDAHDAARRPDDRRELSATPSHEVVDRRQGDVFKQQSHYQLQVDGDHCIPTLTAQQQK